MKRITIGLALALVAGVTALSGAAWARPGFHGGFHGGFHSGHGRHFFGHHPFHHRHRFFFHHGFHPHGFIHRPFGSFQPVVPGPGGVNVSGFWRWDGFRWIWVPGQ